MSAQRQIPGGSFINEVGTAQRQIPGGPFANETAGAAASTLPILSAATAINITSSGFQPRVTATY